MAGRDSSGEHFLIRADGKFHHVRRSGLDFAKVTSEVFTFLGPKFPLEKTTRRSAAHPNKKRRGFVSGDLKGHSFFSRAYFWEKFLVARIR